MISIEPGTIFPITRQLGDPEDTATYYVRAFVRNAQNDVLLKTINLTDKGDQRFRGEWEVPYHAGSDYYITIETRVYSDSGYTTEVVGDFYYERLEDKFLVGNKILGGGGGGFHGSGTGTGTGTGIGVGVGTGVGVGVVVTVVKVVINPVSVNNSVAVANCVSVNGLVCVANFVRVCNCVLVNV